MALKKKERELILSKTNGRCGYCGTSLNGVRWHADHMAPIGRVSKWIRGKGFKPTGELLYPENDNIGNMIAACPQCNILKHSFDVEEFRDVVKDRINQLELSNAYRTAKRYGMVVETGRQIKFYFEELQ